MAVKSILMPLEIHRVRLILEALAVYKKEDPVEWGTEIDDLTKQLISHIGFSEAERIVPEIYREAFPEGPPKIRQW